MKTQKIFLVLIIFLMQSVFGYAQYTSKDQVKKESESNQTGDLPNEMLVNKTSRNEDINAFKNAMTMVSSAAESGAVEEADLMRQKLVKIAGVEIARSTRNLKELEDGNIEHLVKWMEENRPDTKLNVKVEMSTLRNRIAHEQYLYGRFKSWDMNMIKESRNINTIRGNMNSFKRDMERNLRFESDKKSAPPPPPPSGGGTSVTKGNAQGGAVLVENNPPSENPMVKNFNESKKIRKDDFRKGQSVLQKSINEGDDKTAKSAFKSLYQVMMDEVNANAWILNMIKSGNVKDSGINVAELTNKLTKQKSLVEDAAKLKTSASTDFSGVKNEILSLVNSFGATL